MQFRLQTLLLVFVVLWTSLAVSGLGGGLTLFVVALVAVACLSAQRWSFSAPIVVLSAMCLLVFLFPAVQAAREDARRINCNGHLCQISMALLNYGQVYGSLPPAYIADKNGKPMHSWRVLILPFLEYDNLYKQYNFGEPWDGPNNKKLLAQRSSIFACPTDDVSQQDGVTTNYLAVVGRNAVWRPGKPRSLAKLADRANTTVMLVETADSDIKWTEPRDYCLDEPRHQDSSAPPVKISSRHSSTGFFVRDESAGAWINFVEWQREFLPTAAAESDKLDTWLSVGGYDREKVRALSKGGVQTVNWTNCCAFGVWLISVGSLLYRAWRGGRTRAAEPNGAVQPSNDALSSPS